MAQEPTLDRFVDRIGAAVVAPRVAMRVSDSPAGQGRASSDIALLLFLALLAIETELFVTFGWMLRDGEVGQSFVVLMVGARQHLAMPVVLLLGAAAVLFALAGRHRSFGLEFDLACVALAPVVLVEVANRLIAELGVELGRVPVYLGYAWFGLLLVFALMQAHSRDRGGN